HVLTGSLGFPENPSGLVLRSLGETTGSGRVDRIRSFAFGRLVLCSQAASVTDPGRGSSWRSRHSAVPYRAAARAPAASAQAPAWPDCRARACAAESPFPG